MTTRGFTEADCIRTVELIDRVVTHHDNEENITAVRKEVNEWMNNFPLYAGVMAEF